MKPIEILIAEFVEEYTDRKITELKAKEERKEKRLDNQFFDKAQSILARHGE